MIISLVIEEIRVSCTKLVKFGTATAAKITAIIDRDKFESVKPWCFFIPSVVIQGYAANARIPDEWLLAASGSREHKAAVTA